MTQVLRRALFCNIRISVKAEFVSHQLPFNCARLLHRNHVIKCFTAPVASANDPIKNGSSVSFFSSGSTNKMAADSKKPPEFKIEEQKHPVEHEEKPEEKSVPMRKRILITGLILAIWGGIYAVAQYMRKQKKLEDQEVNLSKIDIGAQDYELIDHEGNRRTKESFLGRWLLLYFGFTHCPDICPEELEKMAEVVDEVDADKSVANLQPIFVSVDPERDTPEVVKKYVKEFHTKFIGLTGTKAEVKQAAKAFRIYFSAGPKDEDNDYIVDHSIVMYLMNPKGLFVDYYGSRVTPKHEIVNSIKRNMKNYAKLHGKS